jgi:hypothetical protein
MQVRIEGVVAIRKRHPACVHYVNQRKHIVKNTANILAVPGAEKDTIAVPAPQPVAAIQYCAVKGFFLPIGAVNVAYFVAERIGVIGEPFVGEFPGRQFLKKLFNHLFFPLVQNQSVFLHNSFLRVVCFSPLRGGLRAFVVPLYTPKGPKAGFCFSPREKKLKKSGFYLYDG